MGEAVQPTANTRCHRCREIEPAAGGLPVEWKVESEDAVRSQCRRAGRRRGAALELYLLHADTSRVADVGRALGVCEGQAARLVQAAIRELGEPARGR